MSALKYLRVVIKRCSVALKKIKNCGKIFKNKLLGEKYGLQKITKWQ